MATPFVCAVRSVPRDEGLTRSERTVRTAHGPQRRRTCGLRPRVLTRRRYATPIVALVALVALASVPQAPAFQHFGAGCARDDFRSKGSSVRAELCRASGASSRAVVVLHGCGGFSTFDHRLATELPRFGISTLDVDYFELTPPPGRKGFCGFHGATDPFPTWVTVVRDAAAALGRAPGVDPKGIGVVGWSLGGGLALAVASTQGGGHPFHAVAGFSTGGFGVESLTSSLPPTILLSGGRTDAIPLSETLPLFRALRAAHVPSALYVYPHGSHNWPGRQGTLGIEHAAAFLKRHLR
jgi:dienelactone hydrolase